MKITIISAFLSLLLSACAPLNEPENPASQVMAGRHANDLKKEKATISSTKEEIVAEKTFKRPAKSIEDVLALTRKVSYFLRLENNKTNQVSIGMAVAVASNEDKCILLTNRHVIDAGSVEASPWTAMSTSDSIWNKSTVIYKDDEIDVALLYLLVKNGCQVIPPVYEDPKLLSELIIPGQVPVNKGIVSHGHVAAYWKLQSKLYMISDNLTALGFSGAPSIDLRGYLCGLVTGKTRDKRFRGWAYIIPPSSLFKILLLARDYATNPTSSIPPLKGTEQKKDI